MLKILPSPPHGGGEDNMCYVGDVEDMCSLVVKGNKICYLLRRRGGEKGGGEGGRGEESRQLLLRTLGLYPPTYTEDIA